METLPVSELVESDSEKKTLGPRLREKVEKGGSLYVRDSHVYRGSSVQD